MFSRVQTDVLLNVLQNGENKREKSNIGQQTEVWSFNPFFLMDFFIDIDRIKMGLSYYRFTGHIFQSFMFYVPKDYFNLNKQCRP